MTDYADFLASKVRRFSDHGFEARSVNKKLFDWQQLVVKWALRRGRAALWQQCGMGKTAQQLAWADAVVKHTNGNVLVLTPLAVSRQTEREAAKFGIDARVVSSQADVKPGISITNYHKLKHFDTGCFDGVVLDESSILKSFTGTIKNQIVDAFRNTPYRLACTATPAPNDYMELGNHAEFLGVMPSNEMLARWFINDPAHVGKYRLKGHAEADFWQWITSWACCLRSPADLGFDASQFILPELNYIEHCVEVDVVDGAKDCLFRNDSLTATKIHEEMRRTAPQRAEAVAKTVAELPDVPWLIWCNTDYEADELKRCIPYGVDVRGSHSDQFKEETFADFTDGNIRCLISKPVIAGFGMNWQHCWNASFVGLSYSFEQFYQAMLRTHRYGQKNPVNAHVFFASTEGQVLASIKQKQKAHEEMFEKMASSMRQAFSIDPIRKVLTTNVEGTEAQGDGWRMIHSDCVEAVSSFKDDSVAFSIYSPPFSNLYIYSDSLRDMGNASDDEEFYKHYGYLIPEILRVTLPGRLTAVHCKDLPLYRGRDGEAGLKDFPGAIVALHEKHGWTFHSRVTIWKCPVTERERTNNNGLLHKTVKRDSSQLRMGMADYLLVFRKPPLESNLSVEPVLRPKGFKSYIGDPANDPRTTDAHPSKFARKTHAWDSSIDIWRRYAEPVWWDIDQQDVLNEKIAREGKDERHICPLQIGLIERAVQLWSNPGDLVLSPFAGIGSEGVGSIRQSRRFVGVELKKQYFDIACRNLNHEAKNKSQPTLFDCLEHDTFEENLHPANID